MKNLMEKSYDPSSVEEKIYDLWQRSKVFEINYNSKKTTYSIVLPPPNITGALHMGHALDFTLQDVLARFKRMMGFEIIWIPGTDHAAISTEVKVVQKLKEEGLSKESLGYSEFISRCWKWKETYGSKIVSQIKRLGASCDWSKERFTLDEGCSRAVNEFFVRLYKKNLIYRGNRIVNWCPNCKTSVSDIEVDYKECESDLVYLKYFIDDERFLTVATTRPETIFGDSALAVNPSDSRYKDHIGKFATIPISGRKIKIIADDYVDKSFGTGVLKVTPCHDFADFEISERHKLEQIQVVGIDGKLNEKCLHFAGLSSNLARKEIIKELSDKNFLVKTEKIQNNVGKCSRCETTIEPLTSVQWFVRMKDLSIPAIEKVKNGDIKFVPDRFSKIYMHWMNSIKDWCISRQIWWGHSIPAWICNDCGHINVSKDSISECENCKSTDLKKEHDSLDTWFSSALWPFSVLGWPENDDLTSKYYPTDVVITGYDIIFFWVARMIFSSLEMTKKIPFRNVVIHGLIRDSQGRKMSKSLGNGVDPIDIISKYGTDALRLSLITGLTLGNDTRFSDDKLSNARNFVNKVWNAARFLKMKNPDQENKFCENFSLYDSWILSKLNSTIKEVISNMEKFEFGISLQKITSFFWNDFCDWYLEFCKISPSENICFVFCQILKLLHPFAPFVTEKIWSFFNEGFIATSNYCNYDEKFDNKESEIEISKLIDCIHSVRIKRNEMKTSHNKKIKIYVKSENLEIFKNHENTIKSLANVGKIVYGDPDEKDITVCTLDFAKIMIPIGELSDMNAMHQKLLKESKNLQFRIEKNKNLLENSSFLEKAPKEIIDSVKVSLKSDELKLSNILKMI